jgi:hypothetical protein
MLPWLHTLGWPDSPPAQVQRRTRWRQPRAVAKSLDTWSASSGFASVTVWAFVASIGRNTSGRNVLKDRGVPSSPPVRGMSRCHVPARLLCAQTWKSRGSPTSVLGSDAYVRSCVSAASMSARVARFWATIASAVARPSSKQQHFGSSIKPGPQSGDSPNTAYSGAR